MAERLALFVSGGGTTMNEMLKAMNDRRVSPDKIVPALVIASKPDIGAIDKARVFGLPVVVIDPQDFKGEDGIDREGLGQANRKALEKHRVTVATLNGYIPRISSIEIDFLDGEIYNQHPADPRLFGKLYGKQTHAAVLDFSDNVERRIATMATAHRVTEQVDEGPIVVYETILVPKNSTSDSNLSEDEENERFKQRSADLQKLVLPREHANQILLIRQIGDHSVAEINPPRVVFSNEGVLLERARARAVDLFPHG